MEMQCTSHWLASCPLACVAEEEIKTQKALTKVKSSGVDRAPLSLR